MPGRSCRGPAAAPALHQALPTVLQNQLPAIASAAAARPHCVLTVSLEEWFHGDALARVVMSKHWDRFESRVDRSVDAALALLARHRASATFFVLGVLAERNPGIVQRLVAAGHEVASRGYWPRPVRDRTPEVFRDDLQRAAAASAAAGGGVVRGYRAPRPLGPTDLWVLQSLADQGYAYDSSVWPKGSFWRRQRMDRLRRHAMPTGGSIVEAPITPLRLLGLPSGFADGGSMRQLPHWWLSLAVDRQQRAQREPVVFSLSSWELDPGQPHVTAASRWSAVRHYRNLERTRPRLERHLKRREFRSVAESLGLPAFAPAASGTGPKSLVADASGARTAATGAPMALAQKEPISIVVPMFNEEENVAYLLRTLDAVVARGGGRAFEFVFVDDCSTDGTWSVLQQACAARPDVTLLRHEQNKGVAAAALTGLRAARNEVVATIDCDCSYDPMDILAMADLLGQADLVTASPYHPQGQTLNVPRWRLFLSRTLSRLYQRAVGVELHTWTSCCRVMRRSRLMGIEPRSGGFLGVAETLIQVVQRGGVVREYPTMLESRLLGFSKMKTLRTIVGHLGLLLRTLRRSGAQSR